MELLVQTNASKGRALGRSGPEGAKKQSTLLPALCCLLSVNRSKKKRQFNEGERK